ncbi:hypothetical protein LCGC14_2478970 [marine sediment metagenome]|uniref:Uncharacterized protein n=1 Tax=marine sediment metagenome TaxID=412755 RepID=A0A0F9E1U0_9ZZZZ
MKVAGERSTLISWAIFNLPGSIETYDCGDITFIHQDNGDKEEIGIIAKVEVIND